MGELALRLFPSGGEAKDREGGEEGEEAGGELLAQPLGDGDCPLAAVVVPQAVRGRVVGPGGGGGSSH